MIQSVIRILIVFFKIVFYSENIVFILKVGGLTPYYVKNTPDLGVLLLLTIVVGVDSGG